MEGFGEPVHVRARHTADTTRQLLLHSLYACHFVICNCVCVDNKVPKCQSKADALIGACKHCCSMPYVRQ